MGVVENFLYIKGLERPMAHYFLGLPPCCRSSFRAADAERDGLGPEAFTCPIHGNVVVPLDIAIKIIEREGAQRYHILSCCACTQKNRVDMAKVLATGTRPSCGKCHEPLQGMTRN